MTRSLLSGFVLCVCLLTASCGSSSNSEVGAATFGTSQGIGVFATTGGSSGSATPVGPGDGNPVDFTPGGGANTGDGSSGGGTSGTTGTGTTGGGTTGGGSTGGGTTSPSAVSGVMYIVSGSRLSSLAVANDGSLSLLARDLTADRNLTFLYGGLDNSSLYTLATAADLVAAFATNLATGGASAIGAPAAAGSSPADLAFLAGTNYAYVSNANAAGFFGTNRITRFQVQPDKSIVQIPETNRLATGDLPGAIVAKAATNQLFVANTGENSLTVANIDSTGDLSHDPRLTNGIFPLPARPRALKGSKDGRFLLMTFYPPAGAGADGGRVAVYAFDPGSILTPVSSVPAGTSPLALLEHPDLNVVYVASEEGVNSFSLAADGQLTPLARSIPTPSAGSGPFLMVMTPNRRTLYVFYFFSSFFSSYAVAPDGVLTPTGQVNTFTSSITGAVILPR